ncbi:MAG TPA: class I SAM-dependent methyltransferase, partial [Nocardioides sp.]
VSEQLILGELRSTLTLGARLARDPHHLYARDLIGCLDGAARSQLWTLAKMALRPSGGKLYLEFAVTGENLPEPQPEGLVRRVDPALVQAEIEAAGGVVEHLGINEGQDMLGNPLPGVARLRASWPSLNRAEGN